MMRLRLQILMPVSARCSWNRRMSSAVAVSGDRFRNAAKPLAAVDVAPLRVGTKLTRAHVLDHALAQRADSFRNHRQLLSEIRFTRPRSSGQDDPHATDHLSSG